MQGANEGELHNITRCPVVQLFTPTLYNCPPAGHVFFISANNINASKLTDWIQADYLTQWYKCIKGQYYKTVKFSLASVLSVFFDEVYGTDGYGIQTKT